MNNLPTPEHIQADPASSFWLRDAINAALKRDPVDALNDAEVLVAVLKSHLDSITKGVRS